MNYVEIKSALQNWLHDTSAEFVGLIDTFIRLGEARLNRDLRTPKMIEVVTGSIAAIIPLPADFQEIVALNRVDSSYSQTPIEPVSITALRNGSIGYCITSNGFELSPLLNGTYELSYIPKLLSIVENSTNSISEAHPDLYLYACALEGAAFLRDEKEQYFLGKYSEILQSVNTTEARVGQATHMRADFNVA